jgi:uncharacterized protein (DUF934 family)
VRQRVLVRDGFIDDTWTFVDDASAIPAGDAIVTLARFLREPRGRERARGRTGVRLGPNDDVRALLGELAGVQLVELVLPKMAEGRPYTQARVLREELAFRGDVRAIGEVRRDLLFFLFRCGVSQALLRDRCEERDAHGSLSTFSVLYQGAADVSAPLWRRVPRGRDEVSS